VPDDDEVVAAGACVQAAAVLAGGAPGPGRPDWSLGNGTVVQPDATVDAGAVREAYSRAVRLPGM
jgi:hypothetical protein